MKFKELGMQAKSWPFIEARKILDRINNQIPKKGFVLFETGYGPSGLPHIGTFGEVARTSIVRYAFEQLSNIPTKLVSFSDDLDALRKVPTNVSNQDLLAKDLGKPLTSVIDPFNKYSSFGEYNNTMLQEFLDKFGFEYEFYSATKCYQSGMFDEALLRVLEKYEEITNLILPTLGEERKKDYSPFLPICPKTNKVLQAKVVKINKEQGTIVYINEDNEEVETKVTGGACKLQWKVDWAMRWYALEVDYEMSGKDLIPSVVLSSKICKILGKNPPQSLTYELFLDKNGEKISKSKGNGLTIDEWLRYGDKNSLSYFMFQKPQTAKRLYFDVIPKSVEEWISFLKKYATLEDSQKLESPIFFIHKNNPPKYSSDLTWGLILNLIAVVKSDDKGLIWGFINKYRDIPQEDKELIDSLLDFAINYFNDFIKPNLSYKVPNQEEKELLEQLKEKLTHFSETTKASEVQQIVYQIGKDNNIDLKEWFKLLYQTLLGQNEGPRMGSFFALYGIKNSIALIDKALQK